jgi:hypothetical protein
MKLSQAQERMLRELAQKNSNENNEWRIRGRGPLATCASLARMGLVELMRDVYFNGQAWYITERGTEELMRRDGLRIGLSDHGSKGP